jgi:tRNA modification GTPase
MNGNTIAAIATPPGRGGISIIKISGRLAFRIAGAIFRPAPAKAHELSTDPAFGFRTFPSRRLHYGHIVRPEGGVTVDEVLLSAMTAPNTYTGEDVVEINAHGGPAVTKAILEIVLALGARMADGGEFTRRAFLNGRIDLTQAEAVGDLIGAETAKAHEMAAALLDGELGRRLLDIKNELLETRSRIEAAIDFTEEVDDVIDTESLRRGVEQNVRLPLVAMIEGYGRGRLCREGLRLIVVGKPNVGKSSLMNRLVREDRVIVTPLPGTTRDLVQEMLDIGGFPVILTDTAGIHPTEDPVEKIGIQRARGAMGRSDLILFVVDGSQPLDGHDQMVYASIDAAPVIVVRNKSDLFQNRAASSLPSEWGSPEEVQLSAKTGEGLVDLENAIIQHIKGAGAAGDVSFIGVNLRQKTLLVQALAAVERLASGLQTGQPEELWAIDIEEGLKRVNEVLGLSVDDDVLDMIFKRFCVGK